MSNTRTILGISMAPQKNRRLLVVVTHAIPVALFAVILAGPSWVRESGPLGHVFLVFVGTVLFLLPVDWFYQLAKIPDPQPNLIPLDWLFKLANIPQPGPRSAEVTRLGLTPAPRDPIDLDERQVAIRNASHYHAFRFVIFYSFVVFLASLVGDLSAATMHRLFLALAVLQLFIALTLPRANILWTEPDMPEEDRVYNLK